MRKTGLNYMYAFRLCSKLDCKIPAEMEEVDLDNVRKKDIEKILDILYLKLNIERTDSGLFFKKIDKGLFLESNNLLISKFGLDLAQRIANLKLNLESIRESYLMWTSVEFIDIISDIVDRREIILKTIEDITSINTNEDLKDSEDNSDLLDILF